MDNLKVNPLLPGFGGQKSRVLCLDHIIDYQLLHFETVLLELTKNAVQLLNCQGLRYGNHGEFHLVAEKVYILCG